MPRSLTALLLTAFLALSGYVGVRALRRNLLPLPLDRCVGRQFDAALWRDTIRVQSAEAPRGCMVDDLLARRPLVGETRAAVVALLGEPAPTPYFRHYDLVYWLGPERGLMSIDSEWLVMRLDPRGRVSEARVVTD